MAVYFYGCITLDGYLGIWLQKGMAWTGFMIQEVRRRPAMTNFTAIWM